MNHVSLDFLNNDVALDENVVDELFTQVLRIGPPTNMVERIMNSVSTLPQPKPLSQWKSLEFFVAYGDYDQLS